MMTQDGLIFEANSLKQGRLQALTRQQLQAQATQNRERRWVPVVRQSGERKSKDMKITKEGSGLLRWALVEAAWRLVGNSPKWATLFSRLMHRSGKKRAIVAVARKLLCVLYAMLRTSTPYKIVTTPTTTPRTTGKKLVRTSTPDQTTTTGTTAPRTTGKKLVRTSTPDQTTTTETTA